jgi:polyhydroxyalkanoate synthesis regulator phasin
MDGPADASRNSLRELLAEALFAGVGAAALTKDRVDDLVDELTARGQMTRDEARDVVDDVTGRWRGDALRMSERASTSLTGVLRELGLVTRREWEELELRLSQLEHRLRLLETERAKSAGPPPPPPRRR